MNDRKTIFPPPRETLWAYFEWVFWPALLFGFALLTATADFLRDTRAGAEISFWQPLTRELISSAVVLLLILGIILLNRKFPWRAIGLPAYLGLHLVLSIPFTLLHVFGTIIVRMAGPLLKGATLNWEYIFNNLVFEYPKDLIVYVLIISTINFYTWFRYSIGKADAVKIDAGTIAVKTFTGVALVKLSDVEWIEAAKNYVILHIGRKEYFLRAPIKDVEKEFSCHNFIRVHRSAIVNLAKIREIRKSPPRDFVTVLVTGKKIRIGRHYKNRLEVALGRA